MTIVNVINFIEDDYPKADNHFPKEMPQILKQKINTFKLIKDVNKKLLDYLKIYFQKEGFEGFNIAEIDSSITIDFCKNIFELKIEPYSIKNSIRQQQNDNIFAKINVTNQKQQLATFILDYRPIKAEDHNVLVMFYNDINLEQNSPQSTFFATELINIFIKYYNK